MIDFDPKAQLTISSGVELGLLEFSVYHALIGKIPIKRIIIDISMRLFLVPSNANLSKLEQKTKGRLGFLLKETYTRRKIDKKVMEELQDYLKYKYRMFKTAIRKKEKS
jgi:cellulose biosynthesis protein BcsQ